MTFECKLWFEKRNANLMLFLFIVLSLSGFISGVVSFSNPQYLPPGASSFSYDYGTDLELFPSFNEEMCNKGGDFLIQVSPLGCEPAVVRSDLLEEQNVPVFCPLSATKLNPLIDVEAIDYISFSGDYPKGVA